ncbi:MAG: hypothetical protein NTW21_41940 [Verrucomicrobia bacterium]|nr:hypothetical protein [Verrucomicrobiota bacterium]
MRTLARLLLGGLGVSAASADNGPTVAATPAAASDHEVNAAYFTGSRLPSCLTSTCACPPGLSGHRDGCAVNCGFKLMA